MVNPACQQQLRTNAITPIRSRSRIITIWWGLVPSSLRKVPSSTENFHDTTDFIHDKNRFQLATKLVLEHSSKFSFRRYHFIFVWTYFEYLEISAQASYLITSITDCSCENSRQLTTLRIVYLFILLGLLRAGLLRAGVSILWSADTFTFIETIWKHKSKLFSLCSEFSVDRPLLHGPRPPDLFMLISSYC